MKKFNIAGNCVPDKHFMVNLDNKLKKIKLLIEQKKYFTINNPRQSGKTTLLGALYREFSNQYIIIRGSFEGFGESEFKNEENFCNVFLEQIADRINIVNKNLASIIYKKLNYVKTFNDMSKVITEIVNKSKRPVVLTIDVVDKNTNNQVFFNFLSLLREKYILRNEGLDNTFYSVILAGIYDVRNLKLKEEKEIYSNPWNISEESNIDLNFSVIEIASMLVEYQRESEIVLDVYNLSKEIYRYTKGYPFLVCKLCKVLDEDLKKQWKIKDVRNAIKFVIDNDKVLFDDIFKNLENNIELYNLIEKILLKCHKIRYNHANPLLNKGITHGILSKDSNNEVQISNYIFELYLYNYFISKKFTDNDLRKYKCREKFIEKDDLDIENILNKFQELMKNESLTTNKNFIERELRLVFLYYLKPIISKNGFYYIEPKTRGEDRMNIVILFGDKEYIIELKIWYGKRINKIVLKQLIEYLNKKNNNIGYILLFNFSKNRKFKRNWINIDDKRIYFVVV